MNKEIYLTTPFITVRADARSENFRPAATGFDIRHVTNRADMEKLEIDILQEAQPVNVFSSAAHSEIDNAVQNAYFEAAEKVAIAQWWAYREPSHIRAEIGRDFELHDKSIESRTTFVSVSDKIGRCAVTILRGVEYPYYVLGAGFSNIADDAAKKSHLEAVNSWVGTQWSSNKGDIISWDSNELAFRWNEISKLDPIDINNLSLNNPLEGYLDLKRQFKDFELHTISAKLGHVAWLSYERSMKNYEIAELFDDGKKIEVYTSPNN